MQDQDYHDKTLLSTPEYYLKPISTNDNRTINDIDAITCALSRAKGVCGMLNTAFDGSEEYTFSNTDVANSIWAIEGLIEQALILTMGKGKKATEAKL